MKNIKYMVLVGVSIGSICSVSAMKQQPADGQGPWSVQRSEIVRLIAEGQVKIEQAPQDALDLFQQAYDKKQRSGWAYGLRDGKLVLVSNEKDDLDKADICDIQMWKSLLDQVYSLHKQASGQVQEKAAILCALTAKRFARAFNTSLIVAEDMDVAWQAEKLDECLRVPSSADELAFARDMVGYYPTNKSYAKDLVKKEKNKKKEIEEICARRKEIVLELQKSHEQDF